MKNEDKTKEQLTGELLELRNREEWYRILYEENPSMYFTLDPEGKVLSVNSFGAEQLGYTVEELVGQSIFKIIYEEDRKILLGQIAACLVNPGSTTSQELRKVRRDGNIRWMKEVVRSVRAADGRLVILIVCEDITRLKQAEQELRGSEVRYRSLVENVRDIIFTISSDFTFTSLNPAFETITGWQHEQWVGKNLKHLVHPDDLPLAMEIYRRVLDGEVPPVFELRILSKSGDYIITESVITPQIQDGRITSALGITRDITERKRAEEALRAAEAKFRILVEQSLVGIYITRDAKIIYVNPKLAEMLGYTQEEIVTSKSVSDLIAEEDRERSVQYIRKRLRGEVKSMQHTFRGLRKDGTLIDLEVYGTRIELNGIPAVMGMAIDITERKRAEKELQRAHDELEKRVEERTADLAHANEALQVEIAGRRKIEEVLRRERDRAQRYLDIAGVMIVAIGADQKVTLANKKCCEVLGYSEQEIIGKNWFDTFIPERIRDEVRTTFIKLIDGEARPVEFFENLVLTKSGEERLIAWHNAVLRDTAGNIIGTLSSGEDITERERAEEQLRFQTTVLSQVNDAVIAFDNKHSIIYWNDGAQRLYGWTSGEVLGRQVEEVTRHRWLKPEDEKEADSSLESTGSWRGEFVQVRKSGEEIDVEASIRVLRDERGETLGFIAVMRDITERKRIEQRLRLLSAAVEEAPNGIQIIDLDGHVIFSNKAVAVICGFSVEELQGKHVNEMNVEPGLASKVILPAIKETGRWIGEIMIKHRDGRIFPILLNASMIKDSKGGPIAMVGIITDITERKRAEELLRESERRYRNLVELSADMIYLSDREGRQAFVNDAGYRLLEASPEEVIGRNWSEWIHPHDRERTDKKFREMIEQGIDLFGFENRFVSRSGRTIYLLHNIRLLRNDKAEIIGTQGIARDITERRRAEEERERWAAELTRSNEELEQFAYVASHDLQEPLRMISGFTQLLAKRYKGKLGKDADEFVSFIVDGTARMQRVIEDLLAYSRVGTRGKPFEPTDCENIFNQAVTNLKVAIEENKAEVTHDPLPTVMADPTQMVQLFQNLISNGIKFRKKEETPRIHVSAQRRGNEWIFLVRDNGIGISPEFKRRLFQIFQREHAASEYPGTGIGLAICKKIVERHGGRIWAESVPGQGSTFCFTLPVKKSERQSGLYAPVGNRTRV